MSGFGAYETELQSLLAGDLASTDPTKFASETQTLLEQLKVRVRVCCEGWAYLQNCTDVVLILPLNTTNTDLALVPARVSQL